MSQVRLLKIASDGIPLENSLTDDVTFNSYTVNGTGQALATGGLSMADTPITGVSSLLFTSPATGFINQTAGNLLIDNLMAKERSNPLTTAADILFPVITDTASQVDALRLPAIAGPPSATPTAAGSGFLVYDSTNSDPYIWTGTSWHNLNDTKSAQAVDNTYTAATAISAKDVVYISSTGQVSPAAASSTTTAQVIGFAETAASATQSLSVRSEGLVSGFSALTTGSRYYLDPSTPGAITSTIPSGSGHTIVQVGYAKSPSILHIQLQSLGRRA